MSQSRIAVFVLRVEMHSSTTDENCQHILDRLEDIANRHPQTQGIDDQNWEWDD